MKRLECAQNRKIYVRKVMENVAYHNEAAKNAGDSAIKLQL